MQIGLSNFVTDYSMPITDLAREAEERGFDSLWVPEHTHIPVSRATPWPGGSDLPKQYWHSLDPFASLAAAAAVTTTIKLGTGITLIIERDTITTAKAAATVDLLSGGRFQFGLGGGWNREEAEHHGTQWSTRFKRLEEQVQAMQAIWTEDEPEFHGQHVDFDPIWSWPKPVQKPLPILLGGETIYTLRRVVKYNVGWLPRARQPEQTLDGVTRLRQIAEEAGRDPTSVPISIFGGSLKQEWIDRFDEANVDRIVLGLPSADADTTRRQMDRYQGLLG